MDEKTQTLDQALLHKIDDYLDYKEWKKEKEKSNALQVTGAATWQAPLPPNLTALPYKALSSHKAVDFRSLAVQEVLKARKKARIERERLGLCAGPQIQNSLGQRGDNQCGNGCSGREAFFGVP